MYYRVTIEFTNVPGFHRIAVVHAETPAEAKAKLFDFYHDGADGSPWPVHNMEAEPIEEYAS